MRSPDSNRTKESGSGWLVLLYGTLEFDGRVQRMVDVLQGMGGQVAVVDVQSLDGAVRPVDGNIIRVSVPTPARCRWVMGHILLLIHGLRAARGVRPAVVVAEDYYTAATGWLIARVFGAQLVYDAHELIIPEPESRTSMRRRFWYVLERLAVKGSNLIITANDERARLMAHHYDLAQVPVVMRNIPPLQRDAVAEDGLVSTYPALARRSNLEVLIAYQGSISLTRGLGDVIDALSHLPDNYRLILIGDGPDLGAVIEMTSELRAAGRVGVLGRIPHGQLQAVAATADVGIVVYPYRGLNNVYCAPNKLFEYAQAGLPVVTTCQPMLQDIVGAYDIGVCVERDAGSRGFARAIEVVAARQKTGYNEQIDSFLRDHTWDAEAESVRLALRRLGADEDGCE